MLALLAGMGVVIVGVGILCFLLDMLVGQARETNNQLKTMKYGPVGHERARCIEHNRILPHHRCSESEAWLDNQRDSQ